MRQVKHSFLDVVGDMFFPGSSTWFFYTPLHGNIYFNDKSGRLCCIRENKLIKLNAFPQLNLINGGDGHVYFISPNNPWHKFLANEVVKNMKDFKAVGPETVRLNRISDTIITTVLDFGFDSRQLFRGYVVFDTSHIINWNYREIELFDRKQRSIHKIGINISGAICKDREGNLWLGSVMGLIRVLPLCFTNYTEEDGLHTNNQFVAEDLNGNMVTGNYDEGLQVFRDERFISIKLPVPQNALTMAEVYPGGGRDHKGMVHVCANPMYQLLWNGRSLQELPDYPVTSAFYFYEDPKDFTDYLGTNYGVMIHKENGFQQLVKVSPGNKKNKVVSITRDGKGRFLLGGFHGLSFMEGSRIRQLPDKEYPYDLGANAMVTDHRKNVWIGNGNGLYFFDNSKFTKVMNPWFNDLVVSLCVVDSNMLFIGGLRGIGLLDLNRFYQKDTVCIRYFDRDNGFTGNECQQNAVTLDKDGMIWFATTNSLVRLDPRSIPISGKGPAVYISGVGVIDEAMNQTTIISTYISAGTLDLTHKQGNLRFDFTGICFRAPAHVRYRFMLKGYDKEWSHSTADRFTVYTNLQPGRYEFRVIACNDEGMRSEKPAVIAIYIQPAIWQTWWFLTVMIILAIMVISGATLLIFRRIRQKKQYELEHQKTLAELQFKTLRNQLAPHFIFNALNAIGSSIYRNEPAASYDLLHKFSRLIRHTLNHADRTSRTLAEEVEFVKYYLEIEKVRFEGRIDYAIHIGPEVSYEILVPRMIIQTFVENAVKHGLLHKEGPGFIRVNIASIENILEILISDDGIGRTAAEQFRGDSTGKGMEIIREFIRLFNAFNTEQIRVDISDLQPATDGSAGTRVRILIPLKYSYKLTHETSAAEDHSR